MPATTRQTSRGGCVCFRSPSPRLSRPCGALWRGVRCHGVRMVLDCHAVPARVFSLKRHPLGSMLKTCGAELGLSRSLVQQLPELFLGVADEFFAVKAERQCARNAQAGASAMPLRIRSLVSSAVTAASYFSRSRSRSSPRSWARVRKQGCLTRPAFHPLRPRVEHLNGHLCESVADPVTKRTYVSAAKDGCADEHKKLGLKPAAAGRLRKAAMRTSARQGRMAQACARAARSKSGPHCRIEGPRDDIGDWGNSEGYWTISAEKCGPLLL